MNRLLICFSTALLAITSLAATAAPIEYNIIPRPAASRVDTAGGHFVIARGTLVVAPTAQTAQSAQYLARYCEQYLGLPLRVAASARAGEPAIELSIAGSGPHEGYTLQVDSTGIAITGNDEAGLFYGVQSLLQLLPTRAGLIPHIAAGRIDDAPRFGYRGMLLDVVRHFFPVAYIEKYIDWLALHKMNVFHWHLTDDQGWCIELKSHPELTARGSYRAGEIKGFFPGVYHDMPYQAYYTQEQVKHIIDYAAQRHVTVVPEIDIPGHCMAVLAAHPEFSTTPHEPKHTARTWGIYNRQNNVLAPTPQVFQFLTDVFTEVCQLFPGPYVHAGGDECAPKWWEESHETRRFMKKHNLKNGQELQAYFENYVRRVINAQGKIMMGWSGGAEGVDPQGSIIEDWLHRSLTSASDIDSTHHYIMASSRWYYLNSHEDSLQTDLQPPRKVLPVKDVYNFNILPDSATAVQRSLLLGIDGCVWTEYQPDTWKIEHILMPRLSAIAERAWSLESKKDYDDFARRLVRQLDRYDLWGVRYNHSFERSLPVPRER